MARFIFSNCFFDLSYLLQLILSTCLIFSWTPSSPTLHYSPVQLMREMQAGCQETDLMGLSCQDLEAGRLHVKTDVKVDVEPIADVEKIQTQTKTETK